jgi:hypothetical protein
MFSEYVDRALHKARYEVTEDGTYWRQYSRLSGCLGQWEVD